MSLFLCTNSQRSYSFAKKLLFHYQLPIKYFNNKVQVMTSNILHVRISLASIDDHCQLIRLINTSGLSVLGNCKLYLIIFRLFFLSHHLDQMIHHNIFNCHLTHFFYTVQLPTISFKCQCHRHVLDYSPNCHFSFC